MDWLINGIPIHVLLVHFVVVMVPLAGLCLVLSLSWPAARRRLGIVTPLLALAALISVPLTVEAGEALEEQVAETELTEIHTELGEDLLPWAIGLFVVAALVWAWFRYFTGDGRYARSLSSRGARVAVTVVLALATIAVVVGSVATLVVIGESGATAVWTTRIG